MAMLTAQDALQFVDTLLEDKKYKPLSDIQRQVFLQSWESKIYDKIAENLKYEPDSIKDIGSNIWRLLSDALGETVTKKNFKGALERRYSSKLSPIIIDFQPYLLGREKAIADLEAKVAQGKKAILILAEGGVGKTSLAEHYLKRYDIVIAYRITETPLTAQAIVEDCLERYFQTAPGREFGISLVRLRDKLQASSKSIGILLDNLESVLVNGHFIPACQEYGELLKMLSAPSMSTLTLLTSREPLYDTSIARYPLEQLSISAWQDYFSYEGINTGVQPLTKDSALSQIHKAYGGNAEFMNILSSDIERESECDLEAYWQAHSKDLLLNPTLENFVQKQFEKLANDNPAAYKLLCRLSCFRSLNPVLMTEDAIAALCWEPDYKEQFNRLRHDLTERSLLKRSQQFYNLHPVIQAEATKRLKTSGEWEITNRAAAAFWSVTVTEIRDRNDALTALEAYYHYLAINDFEKAGETLLTGRPTKSTSAKSRLGRSLYKLGIWQELIEAITKILPEITNPITKIGLQDILADLYCLTGNLQMALKFFEEVQVTKSQIQWDSKMPTFVQNIEIASHLYIGFCQIDLGDFVKAIASFQRVLTLAANDSTKYKFRVRAIYAQAYLEAMQGNREIAQNLLSGCQDKLTQPQWGAWSGGLSLYFLGSAQRLLGNFAEAESAFARAIALAGDSRYLTIKAKCLTGLAANERDQGDFDQAITTHIEAITLAESIGAKSDLAEACLQTTLTYQQKSQEQQASVYFERSLELFSQMDAPLQIERVRKIMIRPLA